jgi:hypothetical protein
LRWQAIEARRHERLKARGQLGAIGARFGRRSAIVTHQRGQLFEKEGVPTGAGQEVGLQTRFDFGSEDVMQHGERRRFVERVDADGDQVEATELR